MDDYHPDAIAKTGRKSLDAHCYCAIKTPHGDMESHCCNTIALPVRNFQPKKLLACLPNMAFLVCEHFRIPRFAKVSFRVD